MKSQQEKGQHVYRESKNGERAIVVLRKTDGKTFYFLGTPKEVSVIYTFHTTDVYDQLAEGLSR